MDLRKPVISDAQSAVIVKPGQRALNYPSSYTKTTSMRSVTLCYNGLNAPITELLTNWFGVVATIGLNSIWSLARAPWFTTHRGNRVNQRNHLLDIIHISCRDCRCQWNTLSIGHHVMLASWFCSVSGIRPDFFFLHILPERRRCRRSRVTI